MVFLYRHETQRFLKYDLQAGSRLPGHCTASGKVLLAALPEAILRETLQGMKMEAVTRYTITDPVALKNDLCKIREHGYSMCDREMSLERFSLAVPVVNDL